MSALTPLRLLALEWRLFAAAPVNLALLALLALLAAFAAYNGVQRSETQRSQITEARSADAQAWAEKRRDLIEIEAGHKEPGQYRDPRNASASVLSARANRPVALDPPPFAAVSAGTARDDPQILSVGIGSRHKSGQASLDDPGHRLDGPFDLAFVVAWLLPLFTLVLSYDVLARDREQGIAPLLASQSVSLGAVVAARLVVRFLALFGIMAGVGLLTASASDWRTGTGLDLAIWLTAVALSIGIWLGLSAAINGRARNSAISALMLLALWIGSALLVPTAAGVVVRALSPPPDRLAYLLELRALETDLIKRTDEIRDAYYAERPANRPTKAFADEFTPYFITELYPRQLAFDRRFGPVAKRVEAQRVEQARYLRYAGFFSPSLALKLISDDLAGHAPERRAALNAAADRFQERWRIHFDRKIAAAVPLTLSDYDNKPEFEPIDSSVAGRASRHGVIFAGLLLWFCGTSLWAATALRRARPF